MTIVYGLLSVAVGSLALAVEPYFRGLSRSEHLIDLRRRRRRVPLRLSVVVFSTGGIVIIHPEILSAPLKPFLFYGAALFAAVLLFLFLPRWLRWIVLIPAAFAVGAPFVVLYFWEPLPVNVDLSYDGTSLGVCGTSLLARSGRALPDSLPAESYVPVMLLTEQYDRANGLVPREGCTTIASGDAIDPRAPSVGFVSLVLPDYIWWVGTSQFVRVDGYSPAAVGEPGRWYGKAHELLECLYSIVVPAVRMQQGRGAVSIAEDGFPQPGAYAILIHSVESADTLGNDDHALPSGE